MVERRCYCKVVAIFTHSGVCALSSRTYIPSDASIIMTKIPSTADQCLLCFISVSHMFKYNTGK